MATIRGGEKFEAAMEDLARRLGRPATLKVGFLENATYPDGKPVAMIAAINEYGAPSRGQPARPFFRRMINAKQGRVAGCDCRRIAGQRERRRKIFEHCRGCDCRAVTAKH
jgi:hypothetical protein